MSKNSTNTPQNKQQSNQIIAGVQSISWGPIPPPETMQKYDQILPGAAERIIAMAEKEQTYRHGIITKDIDLETKTRLRGLNYAFILAILSLLITAFLLFTGKYISGSVIAGATLVLIITAFINGKAEQKKKTD